MNIVKDCNFFDLSFNDLIANFDCGDNDLNDFFNIDAYNSPEVLNFYQRNDFAFVFSTEQQEKDNLKKSLSDTEILRSRQMFFDLMRL